MKNLQKFGEALNRVHQISDGLLTETLQKEFLGKKDEVQKQLEENQFIKVPLVGSFSAGKSSLLNVFTGKGGLLPTDVLPQTAVSYELYYDSRQRVELYRHGNKLQELALEQIKDLNTTPGDIAKVYIDSAVIQDLQNRGIILVDMPGIGSGIERHDAAIFNYISYGTAYILMVDADQGSLPTSTLAFLEELRKYELNPAVLISKIDKKPAEEVKEIAEYITYQLDKFYEEKPYVATISAADKNIDGFVSYLNTLDADSLFAKRMTPSVKYLIDTVSQNLQLQIDVKAQDASNIDEKIAAFTKQLEELKNELPGKSTLADSPEKSTNDIMEAVESALLANADRIADMVVNGENQDTIKEVLVRIVRGEIIKQIKEESKQYVDAVGVTVAESLKELPDLNISSELMEAIMTIMDEIRPMIMDILKALIETLGGALGKVVAVLLSLFEKSFPGWLSKLLGLKDKVLEKYRQEIVPEAICALRPEVFRIVEGIQSSIDERMRQELQMRFEAQRDALLDKKEDAVRDKALVETTIAKLQTALGEVANVAASF